MNLSLPDQSMHTSCDGCLEDDKSDVMMPCFRKNMYDEPLASYSSGSIISQLLRKSVHGKRVLDENSFYLSTAADSGQEDQSSVSSKDSTVEATSPTGHTSAGASPEEEHPLTDHLQAKRARVENIIRVMTGSPNSRQHGDNERPGREARESYRENKRKQRLPQHQEHGAAGVQVSRQPGSRNGENIKEEECHKLKEQLHSMQRLLHQLQEKFLQVYNQEEPEYENGEAIEADSDHEILEENNCCMNAEDDYEKKNRRVTADCKDQKTGIGYLVHQGEGQSLQETLKQELSKAVNDCVDRVFKKVSSAGLDLSPQQRMSSSPELHSSLSADRKSQQGSSNTDQPQAEEARVKSQPLEFYESSEAQSPQDQTEALSLVVRKPIAAPVSSITPTVKRPYPIHQTPFQYNYSAPLHDTHILEHLLKYGPHSNFAALSCMPPSMDRTSPESVDLPWDAISMRSKVTSSHLGHHSRPSSLGAVAVDNLCLPHVKIECSELQNMAERNPYMSLNISFFLK